jgi:hypothetical protein
MADGVLFQFAERIISQLCDKAFQELGLLYGLNEELEKLTNIVMAIKATPIMISKCATKTPHYATRACASSKATCP